MADVYNDSIPEESYEFDASEEKEEEEYDDPNAYDEQYEEYEAMTHDQLVKKCIDLEWVADGKEVHHEESEKTVPEDRRHRSSVCGCGNCCRRHAI